MFRALRNLPPFLFGPVPGPISDEVRGGIAVGLAAAAVLGLGAASRVMLEAAQTEAVVQTSGAYLTTGGSWFEQLSNPSAWRNGRFRGRQRATSREEERREREQEEREAREERLREEREAREEALNEARALGRARGTYRTVCVRLCDGYFFPISFATTPDRFAADEAACRARCSSSARLYVYPNPGSEPEQMFDVRGQPYSALKTAFLFRTSYDASCTCKPHPWEQEALDRHRLYAERARGAKRAVAAKVRQAPREMEAVAVNPAESPPEEAAKPRRPEGAMLLGVPEARRTPPTERGSVANRGSIAEGQPKRDQQRNPGRLGYGDRSDWRHRAFNND